MSPCGKAEMVDPNWTYTPGTLKHYVRSSNGDLYFSIQELHWEDGHAVPAEEYARLIAAAPQLLAACQHLVGSLAGHQMRRRTYSREKAIEEGKAAIAAATQPQPAAEEVQGGA